MECEDEPHKALTIWALETPKTSFGYFHFKLTEPKFKKTSAYKFPKDLTPMSQS